MKQLKLDEKQIKQLIATRYLYQLASDQAAIDRNPAVIACISLLHDALETFLIAGADFLNSSVKPHTEFSGYLDKINEKLPNDVELPYRSRLIQINKVRVNSKHHGVRPDHTELMGYLGVCKEFFTEATNAVFDQDFWSLSLVDTLNDGEAKDILKECEQALSMERYRDVLILARRAFFLEFEKPYDVKAFEQTSETSVNVFVTLGCFAPNYTRNSEYINEHVKCPFDYIVLDHGRIDAELTKLQIDHGVWWNIWRLTPEVYRHSSEDEWVEKNALDIFEEDGLQQRAAYVFENTVDVIRKKEAFQRSLRWVRRSINYQVFPKSGAPIFEKASRNSKVLQKVPENMEKAATMYSSPGLEGSGVFWYVLELFQEGDKNNFVTGFIDQDDINWD